MKPIVIIIAIAFVLFIPLPVFAQLDPSGIQNSLTHRVEIPVGTSVPGCEETNSCWSPADITIDVGDTVEWINVDTAAHTVTGGSPADGPSGIFDSSLVMVNTVYKFTFDDAGSYDYFCMVHPWMTGTITVGDGDYYVPQISSPKIVSNEIGSAELEQSVYNINRHEDILVKVFGNISNPLKGSKVGITITTPEHDSIGHHVFPTSKGYYELYLPFYYNSPEGTYKILVSYSSTIIGQMTFDITHEPLQINKVEPERSILQNPEQTFELDFIESSDFRILAFNALPGEVGHNPEIRVNSGEEITLTVNNAGKSFHSFGIVSDPKNIDNVIWNSEIAAATNPLKPGESGSTTFTAGLPGTYYYICTVPGHALQGMMGKFIVGESIYLKNIIKKEIPAPFVDPSKDPWSYVDRYNNEDNYKEWFDENHPQYSSIYEAVGLEELKPDPEPLLTCGEGTESVNGICQIISQTPEKIIEPVNTILVDKKESVDLLLHKADSFLQFKYYVEAFSYYDAILSKDPNNSLAKNGKDQTWNIIQGHRKTIQEIDEKISKHTETSNDLLIKGNSYNELREFEEALKVCSTALNKNSQDSSAFLCKIKSLSGLKNYNEILKQTQYYSHLTSYFDILGPLTPGKQFAQYHLGKYDDLLKSIDIRIEVANEQQKPMFLLFKALVLEKAGKISEADEYFQSITALSSYSNPYGGISNLPLGKAGFYFVIQDYKKSIEYLEQISHDNPGVAQMKVIAYYELEQSSPISQFSKTSKNTGGGCLIATATYGSELAPQVQQLRELRDNSLLSTQSGTNFMNSFNEFYYSFSPVIADYERENPVFREMVKIAITPMITSLSILNYVDMDSEAEVLGYGISLILLNVGMYFVAPAIVIVGIRKKF